METYTTPFSTLISMSSSDILPNTPFKLVTKARVTESFRVTASRRLLMRESFSRKLSNDFSRFSAPFCESVVKFPKLLIRS